MTTMDAAYFIRKFEAIPDELWCVAFSSTTTVGIVRKDIAS